MLTTRIFPFSPGIAWDLDSDVVKPKVNHNKLTEKLKDKQIIVAAFGGLFESVCSFGILENLNFFMPELPLFWSGHEKFKNILHMNGLAHFKTGLNPDILLEYPVPLFFDATDKAIFNCLNNYLNVHTFYGSKAYFDKRSVVRQIVEKGLLPWNVDYRPRLRQIDDIKPLDDWMRIRKFQINQPFIVIIPDTTGHSLHERKCLNWNLTQIKAFNSLARSAGFNVLIFDDCVNKYQAETDLFILPINLEYIIYFLSKASAVLSQEIDYLLVTNLIGQARIIALRQFNQFKLSKNNRFLSKKNVILTKRDTLSPLEAFQFLMEKHDRVNNDRYL